MASRINQTAREVTKLFAAQLRAARMLKGYQTAGDAAEALGIEKERYRRWERGETEPGLYHLVRIRETFGVSLDTLVLEPSRPQPKLVHRVVNAR